MECPGCSRDNPAGSRYCASCGARLAPAHTVVEGNSREGERRQLTVMFCDLVDSTGLGERLDPEELRDVLDTYEDTCSRIVEKFDGHVAQSRGDGLLVYFSYPRAHEDDAERAVRAGLEIVSALGDTTIHLASELPVQFRVRIGIHTGPVVVGEMGNVHRRETLALGHTLNLAARLQGIADPDRVVMSEETLRLVRGLFVTEELGSFRLKGIADPVVAHHAIRPSGVRSRLDVAGQVGLTPLVGREQEVATLLDHWDRVEEGVGQVVLVSGEAGIGKSRLMRTLRDRLADERHTWLECCGSRYHPNSAFHPVIGLLRQSLRFSEETSADEEITAIERAVEPSGMNREAAVPLIAKLLSIPLSSRYVPLELGPDVARRRTIEALVGWLLAVAKQQPVVLLAEDLHWTDPSSLELFGMLIGRVPTARILFIATFRPIFEPSWPVQPHVAQLIVQPLTRRQTMAMVRHVAGDVAMPPEILDHVVRKTDGVPLFIEELTKNILESGLSGDQAIPSTLQDSLMARLDRLGPAKEVAQLGAVLGREFSFELIAATSTMDHASLEQYLRQLSIAGLVHERGEPPETSFTFKHVLIQDAAYQSLLRETRRAWHGRIARVLVDRFPKLVASEPEQVARHCDAGALVDEAITYYHRAGELAMERSAHPEAIGHLSRGIELLGKTAESSERNAREVVLQLALGASIGASRGWGTDEAERSYDRARQLCEGLGETQQLFPVLRGLVVFYTAQAKLDTARDFCARLVRLAERTRESSQLLLAHYHMGVTDFFRGDPSMAAQHFERALVQYDPSQHRSLSAVYQTDPGVNVRIWMAWPLWMLGFPDRALKVSCEGIEMAREAAHPFSLGYALVWTAVVHLWRGQWTMARQLSEEAIEVARDHDFAAVLAGGRITRSVACLHPQASEAEIASAFEDFQQAVTDFGTAGTKGAGRPHTLGQLADALARVGRPEGARMAVEAALVFSEQTSQGYWDAELHRLKGELLLQDPETQHDAERHLRVALELSRAQKARMLELRAAISLCRLARSREERGDRGVLAAVYGSFTEGFDTPELVEARALLDRLQ
jgi:class 3 adenylate cyclase/predicted ATPase